MALEAPEYDAIFYEHLLHRFGFDDVRTLSDRKLGIESPHRGNIVRGVRWLVAGARPGDSLAFVFAGHGTTAASLEADTREHMDRALCASEIEGPDRSSLLLDLDFQALFAPLPPGVLVTCILDCPYGDTVVRLPWYYDAKKRRSVGLSQRGGVPFGQGLGAATDPGTPSGARRPDNSPAGQCPRVTQQGWQAPQPRRTFSLAWLRSCCAQVGLTSLFRVHWGGISTAGVFSGCLAAVLQTWMRVSAARCGDGVSNLSRGQGLSYLELAKSLEAYVQD
eukprot:CAMPEP_0117484124 /NCGR_PEP_ID=MMETSP0784-20121206/14300_1 /TAXON_ID=39447 /ORGANISM="" /LENGTH=277 /DNA_ID=CAMNT_0005278695 /DNA_START=30 /DNA_END=862 /DNA_ORIENTATION=+